LFFYFSLNTTDFITLKFVYQFSHISLIATKMIFSSSCLWKIVTVSRKFTYSVKYIFFLANIV